MQGKIAFEEHWSMPETLEDAKGFVGGSASWDTFQRRILDLGDERLREIEPKQQRLNELKSLLAARDRYLGRTSPSPPRPRCVPAPAGANAR